MTPGERARLLQRQFYLEQAERFRKMADEYDVEQHEANPIPIHGYTGIIIIHGESPKMLAKRLAMVETDIIMDMDHSDHDSMDMIGGGYSAKIKRIYPAQTEESYALDLSEWSQNRKARVKRGESLR